MSATDELRRMLDERGVEHSDFASAYRLSTRWQDSGRRVIEHQLRKDADIGDMGIVRNLTPEQAIAATLGSGTLTAEQVRKAIFDGSSYASYDGAKYYADGIGMQAIADELNATLGRGTCRSTTNNDAWCFVCSECGKSFPRSQLHLAHNHGEINYCPNCGAKVIEEEE